MELTQPDLEDVPVDDTAEPEDAGVGDHGLEQVDSHGELEIAEGDLGDEPQ